MRPEDERYFARIEDRLDEAFEVAEAAKGRGKDPKPAIEIPVARDMADRVENILGIDGVAERVRELEGEMSREEAALELVTDFVEGTVGDYDSREGKIEGAVRTAVALLTEGVVAAPIEGIDRVELLANDDGTEFVNVYYAGPIRSAGGTAQALSVLVADYARSLLGIEEFRPRDDEVERYAEEVALYDSETGLQYSPKDAETKFIARNMPIMLDGEATGDEEVSGFRDLERIDTNSSRGGMCLVLAEGIALKAPKIQRYTRELEEVDWPWLQDLIDGTIGTEEDGDADEAATDDSDADAADGGRDGSVDDADGSSADAATAGSDVADEAAGEASNADAVTDAAGDPADAGPERVDPATKYLRDLIAGRPVFSHPSEAGGFRLRYGRSRNHGFATAGVHPATMHLVDDFLATGTQIKTERPGKAAGVVPVDSIEGPTVRLANGDVRRIDDVEEALAVRNGVEKVLDLGEYLVNFGEFIENNHPLAPASYVYEWWIQEFEASGADVQALSDDPHVDLEHPTVEEAFAWATDYDCPLHPAYTYLWHDVSVERFETLARAVADGEVVEGVLTIERTEATTDALESLLVEHSRTPDSLRIPEWRPLARSLGVDDGLRRTWEALSPAARNWADGENAVRAVNEVAPFAIRERAPTRIGNRMGRPEKSESRDLSPAVHTLFPIGEAGGSQRNVADAAGGMDDSGRRGVVELDVADRECPDCGTHTFHNECPDCGTHTEPYYECRECGTECAPDEAGRVECPRCDRTVTAVSRREIDLNDAYRSALESVGEREAAFEILKGVKGLTSTNKTPEPIEKGVLRAKNGVTAFKDGTVRYDMTDLPVTAVRPAELDVTVGHFRELGYEEDVDGEPLRHDDQLVELKVQDVVLSDGAAEHMMKTADFVDDLLEEFYDLPRFYELNERDDLVGELVFGMAPHTSAATVGRVIGFTSAAVGYAHPYFHAAKRRNCFHPKTTIRYVEGDAADGEYVGGDALDDELNDASIASFVEDRLDPETAETDDVGTLSQDLDEPVSVPSIAADGTRTMRPVESVSKHPAPDHLIRVETEDGRSLRITPDHTMLRRADDEAGDDEAGDGAGGERTDAIERVPAADLAPGDEIPAASPSTRGSTDRGRPDAATTGGSLAPDGGVAADSRVDGSGINGSGVDGSEIDGSGIDSTRIDGSDRRVSDEYISVSSISYEVFESKYVYCLTVSENHSVVANGLYSGQCDGDEDCVMLLMDGLLNFSKSFLPDKRGGSMDAPLVMSSRIDPAEIDDEAHNMDIVRQYPRAFYEATLEMADPEALEDAITIGEDTLGTPDQYRGFDHTHDTSDIALGPDLSAYKTLGSMMDKMDAQLELARTLRAVDETDVAERVIEYHFLPDLIGNLRAFSRQETRCLDCGEKYRRMPLSGECRECGGRVNLTVHEGSVNKYMDTAIAVADRFDCRPYTKQRLEVLERSLESVFEDDTNKQSGIADFM
ncbi:DNA-directed DNA polymerase II large subunit [Halopenitus persicus]|nr:DNA-directed DNA polymerase II large subunit [Halopenitus persicus]